MKKAGNKGFTLIEAMFAMVVLASVCAGMLLPYAAGAAQQAEGQRRTIGAMLAADKLEEIRGANYATVKATYNGQSESEGQVEDILGTVFSDDIYQKFSRSVSFTDVPFGLATLYYVTVTVNYDGTQIAQVGMMIGEE